MDEIRQQQSFHNYQQLNLNFFFNSTEKGKTRTPNRRRRHCYFTVSGTTDRLLVTSRHLHQGKTSSSKAGTSTSALRDLTTSRPRRRGKYNDLFFNFISTTTNKNECICILFLQHGIRIFSPSSTTAGRRGTMLH
ncbi:unnamed protein product [Amoebophrya sp. A120]|nr:unnamed protein product [Amoebophrya sp. A120]|eukprot:GSA120T00019701001.1